MKRSRYFITDEPDLGAAAAALGLPDGRDLVWAIGASPGTVASTEPSARRFDLPASDPVSGGLTVSLTCANGTEGGCAVAISAPLSGAPGIPPVSSRDIRSTSL